MLLTITHLTVNIPAHDCEIRFIIKLPPQSQLPPIASKVPLLPIPISINLLQTIPLKISFQSQSQNVMLCVVAITQNSVIYIGGTLINPSIVTQFQVNKLGGIKEQSGCITYSISSLIDQKTNQDKTIKKQMQFDDSLDQLQRNQDNRQTTQLNQNIQRNKEIQELEKRIKNQLGKLEEQNDILRQQIQTKVQNYEDQIKLLKIDLINRKYRLALQENIIFTLQNTSRINKLIGRNKII